MLNVTLRQLRIFQSAATHLSFARAAQELHLTQPAVSMQIKQLEDTLGFTLFERVGRRVVLSDAGLSIYRCAQDVSGNVAELEWVAQQHTKAEVGRLNIAALTTADYLLPRLITAFLADKPRVTVSLRTGNGATVARYLEENVVDFAVTGAFAQHDAIVFEPLFEQVFVVVAAAPMKPRGARRPISFLASHSLIVREATSPSRAATEAFLAQHGVVPQVRMSLASDEAIKDAVRSGAGIAVMPLFAVQLELETKRLVIIDVEHFPQPRPWNVAIRRGKKLSSIAESFRRFLHAEAPRVNDRLIERAGLGGRLARR